MSSSKTTTKKIAQCLRQNPCLPQTVAMNDALPLKAARRDGIANLKSVWGLQTPMTVMVTLPSYQKNWAELPQIDILAAFLEEEPQKFVQHFLRPTSTTSGKVWLTHVRRPQWAKSGKEAECSICGGQINTNCLWTKDHEMLRTCRALQGTLVV